MTTAKALKLPALLGVGFMIAFELVIPNAASAQTVTMNEAMLERCEAEGLTPPICACWFAEIAEAEELESFTEEDIDALAPEYQEELKACIDANS